MGALFDGHHDLPVHPPDAQQLRERAEALKQGQEAEYQHCIKVRVAAALIGDVPLEPDWYRENWCRSWAKGPHP